MAIALSQRIAAVLKQSQSRLHALCVAEKKPNTAILALNPSIVATLAPIRLPRSAMSREWPSSGRKGERHGQLAQTHHFPKINEDPGENVQKNTMYTEV